MQTLRQRYMGLVLDFTLITQYINAYFHTAFELFMSGAGTIKKKQKKLQDVGKYDYGEGFWSQAFTVLRRYADEQELSTEAFRVLSCRLF